MRLHCHLSAVCQLDAYLHVIGRQDPAADHRKECPIGAKAAPGTDRQVWRPGAACASETSASWAATLRDHQPGLVDPARVTVERPADYSRRGVQDQLGRG